MNNLVINTDPSFEARMNAYPAPIKKRMARLRQLVLEVAEELESVHELHETTKWEEPSFVTKKGSTLRMDWKEKTPDQYAVYFKCTSKLVESFKKVYGDTFKYEKNRAILFGVEEKIPARELKACIGATLQYHLVKTNPLLGLTTSA